MRLFDFTAFYVRLISRTVKAMLKFGFMVLLIIFAFSSFFLVANMNSLNKKWKDAYVPDMTGGNRFFNALITVYFISMGEFQYDKFKDGEYGTFVWMMFLSASFINIIIFMNMLIAIMGETFNQVTAEREMYDMVEKVNFIREHVWILDIEKLQKGKKILIRVF